MDKFRSSEVKKSKRELVSARKDLEMKKYVNNSFKEEARKNPVYNRTEGPSLGEKLSEERLKLAEEKHQRVKARSKRERIVRTSKGAAALLLPKNKIRLG